jgi:UDP-N-acetylmuramoyl-tripeptide--D-alanyl-D-alanine ligase
MWDYDYLRAMSRGIREVVKYGTNDADVTGEVSQSEPFLEVSITKGASTGLIRTQLVGAYNLPNVLVAVTAGKYFGVNDEAIKRSLEAYAPSNSRSQLVEKNGNRIVLDAYNANPSSMKLAIENFAKMPGADKILMLGGMAELGQASVNEHAMILELIQQYSWKNVVLVGGDFLKLQHPFLQFNNSSEAADWYRNQNFNGNYILIKGSRSMQMEKVLE